MRNAPTHFAALSLLCFGVLIEASHPTEAADNGIVAKLEATRMSGPAPLAVMFDATGTAISKPTDAFREVIYDFDFGDDRNLNWVHSGQPRNKQMGGPLAAHVFDLPGTYTVRLRATAPDGQTSEASLAITVEDPNKVYSGEKTVCVSPSGKFDGCPAKAVRDTRLPVSYGGKRVLLNRGEAFGVVAINRNSDKVIVGSYGKGAKPVIGSVQINSVHPNGKFADNLVITNLDISNGIHHLGSGSRYLIYQNDLVSPGGDNMISIGGAIHYQAQSNPGMDFYNPREIFIVDNLIRGQVNQMGKPLNNITALGAYLAIIGNDISRTQDHSIRLAAVHKGIVAHNALRGMSSGITQNGSGPSIRHALKVHAGGLSPYEDDWRPTSGRWSTSQLIIANNVMGDTENNSQFVAKVAPENNFGSTIEGIEDVIVERNRFVRGPHTNTEVEFYGRRITTRDNTRTDGATPRFSVGPLHPGVPADWHGPYFLN